MTVLELAYALIPQLNAQGKASISVINAVNIVATVIFNRLRYHKHELVTSYQSLTLAAGDNNEALPTGYMGLFDHPYISGEEERLERARPEDIPYLSTLDDDVPTHYDIDSANLIVYPGCLAETTIVLPCFIGFTRATLLTSNVPFSGRFDDLFTQGVLRCNEIGGIALPSDPVFGALVNETIEAENAVRKGAQLPTTRELNFF